LSILTLPNLPFVPVLGVTDHASATHAPAVHTWPDVHATAFAHVVPQLPLSLMDFSQPFAALASQSSVPAAHAPHAPAVVHDWLVVQAVLEQPQLASVFVFSQPFAALLSQSSVPLAQAPHAPVLVLQVWAVVQAVAEQPQLASVFVFSQAFAALPSQSSVPAAHVAHAPELHVWLVVQAAVEHVVPQLASVLIAFSQPFGRLPSQLR
jgi:hypothetical protein